MKIKLKTSLAGHAGVWQRGDFYECGAAEAARLIEAGLAEAVQPKKQKAVQAGPKATRLASVSA